MAIKDDTRDRLIALERDVGHISKRMDNIGGKVDTMHDILQQGKGAKYMLLGQAGFMGAIAGLAVKFWPWH